MSLGAWKTAAAVLVGALALAACATVKPKPPPPLPAPVEAPAPPVVEPAAPIVRIIPPPPRTSCVPKTLPRAPRYPDSDGALKDAGGAADRYQLMAAGR